MSARSLVTGATGFVGSHLTHALLDAGDDVTVLHRSSAASGDALAALAHAGAHVTTYREQSEIRALVEGAAPERVFHLATRYTRTHAPLDISPLVEANIAFGTQLLDALVGSETRVVSTMSFFQYRQGEPAPFSLYSATKEAFSDISRYYREVAGVDLREAVLYDTYGPGDTRDKLVPHLLTSFATGSPMHMGPSAQPINLLYATDVAAGLIATAAAGVPARVTLTARDSTVGEVVETLRRVTGIPLESDYDETRSINDLVVTSGPRVPPPGWTAQVSLADGLRQSWEARA